MPDEVAIIHLEIAPSSQWLHLLERFTSTSMVSAGVNFTTLLRADGLWQILVPPRKILGHRYHAIAQAVNMCQVTELNGTLSISLKIDTQIDEYLLDLLN